MCYWKVTVLKHQQGNLRLRFRLLNSDVQNPNMRLNKLKISLRDFLFLTSTSSRTLLIQIGILDFIFYKTEYLLNAHLFVQAIFVYSKTSIIRSVWDRQIFFELSVVRIFEIGTFRKCSVVFVRYKFSTV